MKYLKLVFSVQSGESQAIQEAHLKKKFWAPKCQAVS